MQARADGGRFARGVRSSPETMFKPGERRSPRTEFKPGEHRSRASEFTPGQAAHNHLPVGSETVRVEWYTGKRRAWVKVAEPNRWRKRAIVVWESTNGPLPRGMVVHHIDRDALNDDPANLVALTRAEHVEEHRAELESAKGASC